jgi:hypothetical protein
VKERFSTCAGTRFIWACYLGIFVKNSNNSYIPLLLIGIFPTLSIYINYGVDYSVLFSQISFITLKILLIGVPIYWTLRVDKEKIDFFIPKSLGIKYGFISGIAMASIIMTTYLLFSNTINIDLMKFEIGETGLLTPKIFVLGVLYWIFVNSLAEEFVFRKFVATKLFDITDNQIIAIAGSATFFTFHHTLALTYYFEPWQVIISSIGIFGAGVIWSWLYLRFNSVFVCWISHSICDVAIFGIGYILLF